MPTLFAGAQSEETLPPRDLIACDGCDLSLVEVRVTEEGAAAPILVQQQRVLSHAFRHFAVASVGFNDADGREATVLLDDLVVRRADGTEAAWDFAVAPTLLRGASGQDHTAIRHDAANEALAGVVNSSYGCAPGYQTIEVAPPEGAAVVSMSIEFQKVTSNRGGSDHWDLHVGLVPDNHRPAIHTPPSYNPCEPGVPQGFVQELVGLRIEGSNIGWRHTMDAVFNGSADGRVVADHHVGARYRIDVSIAPVPLAPGVNLEAWGEGWEIPATVNGGAGRVGHLIVRNGGAQPTAPFGVLFTPDLDRPCPAWEWGDDPFCSIVRVAGLAPGEVGIVASDPMEGGPGQRFAIVVDVFDEIVEFDEGDNRFLSSDDSPDLRVAWIGHDDWRSLYTGDTLHLSAYAENMRHEMSSAFTVTIAVDGEALASATYEPLRWAGVLLEAPAWNATLGRHAVTATVTSLDPAADAIAANNVKTFLLDVQDPGQPGDLVPEVSFVHGFFPHEGLQDAPPGTPSTVWLVIVTVCNEGGGPVRSGNALVTAQTAGVGGIGARGAFIGRMQTGLLAPRACVGELFVWRPLAAIGEFEIVARATSADDVVPEVVLDNNEDRERVGAPVALGAGIIV